ncbi:MAG: hypothetical protein ACTSQE_17315 [Candidatus Heimdallarchaeaceae archaeon]
MSWKKKMMDEWKKLSLKEIKPGMLAKLVIEKSWTQGAWVVGRLGKVYKVVDGCGGPDDITVIVPDWVNPDGETGMNCSDDYRHFEYQW